MNVKGADATLLPIRELCRRGRMGAERYKSAGGRHGSLCIVIPLPSPYHGYLADIPQTFPCQRVNHAMSSIQPGTSSSEAPIGPRIPLSACFLPNIITGWDGIPAEDREEMREDAETNVDIFVSAIRNLQIDRGLRDLDTDAVDELQMTDDAVRVSRFLSK